MIDGFLERGQSGLETLARIIGRLHTISQHIDELTGRPPTDQPIRHHQSIGYQLQSG